MGVKELERGGLPPLARSVIPLTQVPRTTPERREVHVRTGLVRHTSDSAEQLVLRETRRSTLRPLDPLSVRPRSASLGNLHSPRTLSNALDPRNTHTHTHTHTHTLMCLRVLTGHARLPRAGSSFRPDSQYRNYEMIPALYCHSNTYRIRTGFRTALHCTVSPARTQSLPHCAQCLPRGEERVLTRVRMARSAHRPRDQTQAPAVRLPG